MLKKITTLLIIVSAVTACRPEPPTKEEALVVITNSVEFESPLFAPLPVGREILMSHDHDNPQQYIDNKYKALIEANLINVEIIQKNSWRTVINTTISEAGDELVDPRRSDNNTKYVMVCSLKPIEIIKIDTMNLEADSLVYNCKFTETQVTPFGQTLGYANDKEHFCKVLFTRNARKWDSQILEK